MAQGDLTKEELKEVKISLDEMFEAIPKTKRLGFIGHLNDISLFLDAVEKKLL